jgi:branched-chain amino acid transport system ATP-binding protein
MVSPRSGAVRFLGENVAGAGPDVVVRKGMIQVPQGREVFSSMTVRDNLEMGAATRRGRTAIRRYVDDIYELFPRLGERRAALAGSLSGGEQQQLAIGRALMANPKLLLMDEPSVGLSPNIVDSMIETIKLLHEKRGLTILIVEQNVGVAAAIASTAHILKDGEIVFTGEAVKLINDRTVLSSYLGR